ncbi:hypothetical protein [Campylobacter sp. P255]|uniref:hypothetical protein n=1 Tax=Campylobacter sp. P255 TaxID=1979368 RepID=UPI001177995D|nr:hypothetical protein [Campylobacter sp. P255]
MMSLSMVGVLHANHLFLNQDCYDGLDLTVIQDPFFQKTTKIKSNFSLQAIISNKVKIDNKWYALNDNIDGFKIAEIKNSQVVLIKEEKRMVLDLYEKNNIFIY